MTHLDNLINNIQKGIKDNSSYISVIRYPNLLLSSLKELREIIGNEKAKESIARQVSKLIKNARDPDEDDDFMINCIIYGPPGVGKTKIGTKIAKIVYALGYLDDAGGADQSFLSSIPGASKDWDTDTMYIWFMAAVAIYTMFGAMISKMYTMCGPYYFFLILGIVLLVALLVFYFVSWQNQHEERITRGESIRDDEVITIVSREDFVDKYVGWSDKKTLNLLNSNRGKAIFIDEAYSLVLGSQDSFGMEAATCLTRYTSENPRKVMLILGGYKNRMQSGLLKYQPGLVSRCMWHIECSGYDGNQLFDIFAQQLGKGRYKMEDVDMCKRLFLSNISGFSAYGRDTQRLVNFVKLEHHSDEMSDIPIKARTINVDQLRRAIDVLKDNNINSEGTVADTPSMEDLADILLKDINDRKSKPEHREYPAEGINNRSPREDQDIGFKRIVPKEQPVDNIVDCADDLSVNQETKKIVDEPVKVKPRRPVYKEPIHIENSSVDYSSDDIYLEEDSPMIVEETTQTEEDEMIDYHEDQENYETPVDYELSIEDLGSDFSNNMEDSDYIVINGWPMAIPKLNIDFCDMFDTQIPRYVKTNNKPLYLEQPKIEDVSEDTSASEESIEDTPVETHPQTKIITAPKVDITSYQKTPIISRPKIKLPVVVPKSTPVQLKPVPKSASIELKPVRRQVPQPKRDDNVVRQYRATRKNARINSNKKR